MDYLEYIVDVKLKDFALILSQEDWQILRKVVRAVVVDEALDTFSWLPLVRRDLILLEDLSKEQYCRVGIHVWNDLL